MSVRKLVFLLGFPIIPLVVYLFMVSPALERRENAKQRLNDAGKVTLENSQKVTQRDQLESQWAEFRPTATTQLENLETHLNPHLIQKRVLATAQDNNCTIRINQMSESDDTPLHRFTMSVEGDYKNVVTLINDLEQGDHRIRFQSLTMVIPTTTSGPRKEKVHLNGSFSIPVIPPEPDDEPVALNN